MPNRAIAVAAHPGGVRGKNSGQEGLRVFTWNFLADDLATRAMLQQLVAALTGAGLAESDISNTELILAEVLNNIAEHAYADGIGPVEVTVELHKDGLVCAIADQGRPMPAGMVPDPEFPEIAPPDHLPEGGFGWHIIRCLTSDLGYQREDGWNRLTLAIPWADDG